LFQLNYGWFVVNFTVDIIKALDDITADRSETVSMNDEAGRYVMHLLSEHKQNQVEVKSSKTAFENLVSKAVTMSLETIKSLLVNRIHVSKKDKTSSFVSTSS
jgi:hypothetical protein